MSDIRREPCGECGAMVEPGEYHPYVFCLLVKARLNPWREVRIIAGQLGLDDPGEAPPKVWEIVPAQRSRWEA